MPQNKPMKIQWITVNGRQVPLVLPQTYSYKDDDWKITSDQDPLPIVEYGTTEGGVIVPKRVSDEGHELTQLTGSYVEESLFKNITVPAGSSVSPSSYIKCLGNEVRYAIRWGTTTNFKVTIRPRAKSGENLGNPIEIGSEASSWFGYSFLNEKHKSYNVVSNQMEVTVQNVGNADVVLRELVITHII